MGWRFFAGSGGGYLLRLDLSKVYFVFRRLFFDSLVVFLRVRVYGLMFFVFFVCVIFLIGY